MVITHTFLFNIHSVFEYFQLKIEHLSERDFNMNFRPEKILAPTPCHHWKYAEPKLKIKSAYFK